MIGLFIGGVILLLVIVGVLFINLSPEFGGKATQEQNTSFAKSANFKDGKFINLGEIDMDMGFGKIMKMISIAVSGASKSRLDDPIILYGADCTSTLVVGESVP